MSTSKYDVIRVQTDWYFRRRQSYIDYRLVMLKIHSVEVQINLQIGEVVSTIPSEYVIIGFGVWGS
jgi:hypothetical protein